MITHIALLRLLDKINLNSYIQFDSVIEIIENQKFQSWDQIEEMFFAQGILDSHKNEELKGKWLNEIDKIKWDLDSGINFICWNDPNYPQTFHRLLQPPLSFSYIGSPCWQITPCLSVVGSREPHAYTVTWMKTELRHFIKNTNVTVVSGGARGVDFMAHSLCLDLGRPTIVILPSGLRKIYPPSLKAYLNEIVASGGCLISEYDSDLEIRKHLFQHRNRLIAAMNHALLIGEANLQSGTKMTAHLALEMNQPVWVVPGHPLMSAFAGSLDLLLYGGQLVRNADDLKMFFECELVGDQSYRTENRLFFKKVKKNEKSL